MSLRVCSLFLFFVFLIWFRSDFFLWFSGSFWFGGFLFSHGFWGFVCAVWGVGGVS